MRRHHERRHSFDLSYCNNEDGSGSRANRCYEQDKQRRVHFDDEYLACGTAKQKRQQRNSSNIREMNIYETTSKLKESYQNIDKGLEILRQIYDNLKESKQSLRHQNSESSSSSQNDYLSEINSLLEQVEHLEKSLKRSGSQKRQYLDELSKLQTSLHEDRLQMEANKQSKRQDLRAKMNASTNVTREQQIIINKLKRDNQQLWKILQEVKKHLLEEEQNAEQNKCEGDLRYFANASAGIGEPCGNMRPPHLPETPRERIKIESELFPMRDNASDDSNSSTDSSQEAFISEKLNYLIDRSENIQNMISKVGNNKAKSEGARLDGSYTDDCVNQSRSSGDKHSYSKTSSRVTSENTMYAVDDNSRIPSENERGVRCDAKDIIRRCEELERRVEQCSTKEMRDRLIHQLEEIEREEHSQQSLSTRGGGGGEVTCKDDVIAEHRCSSSRPVCSSNQSGNQVCGGNQSGQQQQWHPEIHKRVRGELFKCLDQMSTMEKNFSDAQTEISRLRQYIKETSEQKEFSEKTFKREALQLRTVVEEKVKEVEVLKQNLNDAIKGLKDSEDLIVRIDELEKIVEEKEYEIKHVTKENQSAFVEMKERMEMKSSEVEMMKSEMKSALDSMERLRVTTRTTEKIRLEDTISAEITMLQSAIMDVEQRMNLLDKENMTLGQELDEKVRVLEEIHVENEVLIKRLHGSETEINALRANLSSLSVVDADRNIGSYYRPDERICQLESELTKALSEKESIMSSTLRNTSYVKIDKTTDEQGQVIESLIDDNEKHLETIQRKDRVIEDLQRELRRQQVDGGMGRNESNEQPPESSSNRYLEIIQRKNKTIDELRENLDAVTTEADKKLINELLTTLSNKHSGGDPESKKGIQEELQKINTILSSSHKDLVDKIITLEEGVSNLRNENRSLRKQMSAGISQTTVTAKTCKSSLEGSSPQVNENEKFHRIMEENVTLRDSLNRPYPGLVQNILTQTEEVKRLHEENELLRLGLSENKRELVDSNLRKRQRIKDLQSKLEEYEGGQEGLATKRKSRRRSSSLGDDSTDLMQLRKSHGSDSLTKSAELVEELKNQNVMLRRLEQDNLNMAEKSRQHLKEITSLKDECERLKNSEKVRKALEFEVKNLRNALKEISDDSQLDAHRQRIQELEEENQELRDKEDLRDGFTPVASPEKEALDMGSFDRNTRGGKLGHKKALFNAKEDLHRMAKIADKEKKKSDDLAKKMESLHGEKRKLEKEMATSEKSAMRLVDDLRETRRELSHARKENREEKGEVSTLRKMLQDVSQTDSGNNETQMIKTLSDDLDTVQQDRAVLQNKLEQSRQNGILLERENNSLKSKLQEQNNTDAIHELAEDIETSQQEIVELNRQLDHFKQENKELQEINDALVEELERMKSEVNETQFKDWLDQDAEHRLALLSPDTHRSDLGMDENDRQYKKDQQRIVRKLQIENQIMKAKLLSQEDQNIAATKIISDMERGHGHLTGMLRSHLILQRNSTAKLLENSLQQYTNDYDNFQKKFVALEEKYSRQKYDKTNKGREDIWELFTNAGATITNINTILNEGLVKVEDDLEKDLDEDNDQDFEDRDYKSRLWILRRRLSDVENRHRELQLRAEELNLRLDAKQTEFEVTQDELEDATRDLETRENHMKKMETELDHVANERGRLEKLMSLLKKNEDKMVSEVIAENESLGSRLNPKSATDVVDGDENGFYSGNNSDLSELIAKLKERDTALSIMRKMREETEKENDELKRRISYLERKLKEVTDQRNKLQKEAEYRAGYMSFARDDHGTIHMLRDDLKRIAKENADLKHDIVLKQRQMYDMSKDLHKMRIKLDVESSSSKGLVGDKASRKEEKLIQDLASVKAELFIQDTKLKDAERRLGSRAGENKAAATETQSITKVFKQKLAEKEREIEKLKRSASRSPSPTKSPLPAKDDTMSDVVSAFDSSKSSDVKSQNELKKKIEELKSEKKILQQTVTESGLRSSADYVKKIKSGERKIDQQRSEITTLNKDNEQKRKRIRELLTAIEEIRDGRSSQKSNKKISMLVEKTKEDEMDSVIEKLKKSKNEVEEWKSKAESYEKEIEKPAHSTGGATTVMKTMYIMDQQPPPFFGDGALMSPNPMVLSQAPGASSSLQESQPLYEELADDDYVNMYETPVDGANGGSPQKAAADGSRGKKTSEGTTNSISRIPVSPTKRHQGSSSSSGNSRSTTEQQQQQRKQWKIPADGSSGSNDDQVGRLKILLKNTHEELEIYRTNLNMNEQDTLEILGYDHLNYAIDFQVSNRCMTELKTIKNDVYELEHENETLQTNYVNLAETLNDFNDEMRAQVRGQTDDAKNLESRNDKTLNKNTLLEEQISQQRAEIEELNVHLAELNQHIVAQNNNVELKDVVLSETREELKTVRGELSERRKELREVHEKLANIDLKNTALNETREELNTVKSELSERRKVLREVQEDLATKNAELKQKIDEVTQLEVNNRLISEQLKVKTDECCKIQKKLKEQGKAGRSKEEVKKLKEELGDKSAECEAMSAKLKKKTEEYAKIQRKLNGSKVAEKSKELKKVKEELIGKTRELQDISEKLKEKIEEANKLKKQLNERGESKELQEISDKLREKIEEANKLKKQLGDKEESGVEKSSKEDLNMIETLREEISTSSAEIAKRNEIIQELRVHVDKIKQQEMQRRKEENEKLQVIENDHQGKIEALKEALSRKDRESEGYLDETVKAMEDAKERLVQEIRARKSLEEDVKACQIKLEQKIEFSRQKEEIMKGELQRLKNVEVELMKCKAEDMSSPQVNELLEALALSKEDVKTLEHELKIKEEKLAKEKSCVVSERGKLRAVENEFESYKNAAESEIAHFTSEMHVLQKTLSRYEAEKKKVPPPKMPSIDEELIEPADVQESMAVPFNPDEEIMFQPGSELEVELEILQGCNEDLEQEVESLKIELKNTEDSREGTKTELERTREDLRKSLEYLADLNEKNSSLTRDNERANSRLETEEQKFDELQKHLHVQEYQHEEETSKRELKLEHKVKKLEIESKNHADTIEQMEEIIEQLESENVRKDATFDKLRRNNETNIKEMENVAKELEEEIKIRSEENQGMKVNRRELQLVIAKKDEQIQQLTQLISEDSSSPSSKKPPPPSNKFGFETIKERKEENCVEELSHEIGRLQKELDARMEKERELEESVETWIQKSGEQAIRLNKLQDELRLNQNEASDDMDSRIHDITNLIKQNEIFKLDLDKKNRKLQTLHDELEEKEEQYEKVLASLNKRREESKRFLAMQQTLRDEIDSKEDFIRKLNFKMKSHDLDVSVSSLNTSRDDELDQSDALSSSSSANRAPRIIITNPMEEISGEEDDVMLRLSNQLGSARTRNKNLSKELEKCRADFINVKEEKDRIDLINKQLSTDTQTYKDRVSDLRSMIQSSPDIPSEEDDPNIVGMRTKLYASYKELREKSIEIASLRMCIEIKDDEAAALREETEQLREINTKLRELYEASSNRDCDTQDGLGCTHSDDIKTLVKELNDRERNEEELQNQITELRRRLMQKCKQSDYLQVELSKVTTRFRDIEQKLCQDDQDLREKFLHVFENDTSEISEVTPLNSVRLFSAPYDDDEDNFTADELENEDGGDSLNDTFTLDEDKVESYEEVKEAQLKSEEENLFCKEQIKSLREEIHQINSVNDNKTEHSERLENENDDLNRKLSELQQQLQQLKTTKDDVLEKFKQEKQDLKILENKLSLKEQRHIVELDNLKTSLTNAKNEHLTSVTEKMETSFQEKLQYKVKAKHLEEQLKRKEKEIENLRSRVTA